MAYSKKKTLIILIIFLLIKLNTFSQQLNYNLENSNFQNLNFNIQNSEKIILSGFKPIIQLDLSLELKTDSLISSKNWFYRKLFLEDFVIIESNNFNFKINPILNLELKKDLKSKENYFINTRGIEFKGDIGKNFSFYSSFYENQAKYEPYITDIIRQSLVVPGQGAAKFSENNKLDFSRVEAYISYSPNSNFNFQAGHSKHFIGEGYRSLLLSDNAFIYPFIKISSTFGKFKYIVLWSQYQSFTTAYYNYHYRKYSAINYLSYVLKPGFEISIFENIIWPSNTNSDTNFDLNFFNPILFFKSVQYELNNEKNVLIGLNSKIKTSKFSQLYTQLAIDDADIEKLNESKYAFQFGFKYFDLFHNNFKNQTLFLNAEYNQIANYTYAYENSAQNYSNYNQAIAHPAGAGLKEIVGILNYNFKKFGFDIKFNQIIKSSDTTNTNFGSNIFLSDNNIIKNHEIAKNLKTTIQNLNFTFKYIINPISNLQIFASLYKRTYKNELENTYNLFYSFGIRTNINNYYYDY
ncbi:MAG: hypothetical protein JXR51_06065 [Bacteroidales bacterium]|nr:hypothetical protein [Bacteroidales bacterium]MBN2756726.1 hypothetical protein [Bacteroidales bacterium]